MFATSSPFSGQADPMARHALEHDDGAIIGHEWVPAWMHDNPIYFWSPNSVRSIISKVRSERPPHKIAHHAREEEQ